MPGAPVEASVTSLARGHLGSSDCASGGDVRAPGLHGVAAPGEEVGAGVGGFGGVGEACSGDVAGDAGFAAPVAEAAAESVGDGVDAVLA